MNPLVDVRPPTPRRLLVSLVGVVCPPQVTQLDLADDIVAEVELSLRAFSAGARAALLAGLTTYEWGAVAIPRHLGRPASRLSEDHAKRYFRSWWESPVGPMRELAKGVKGLICLSAYEHPQLKQTLDYDPDAWIAKVRELRAKKYAAEIQRHASSLFEPDPLPNVPPRQPSEPS